MKTKLLICLIALLTTGCTLFDRQEKRINYTKMLDWGGQSLVTDAKQRAIINTKAEVGIGDTRYGGGDTTDDQVVKNHPHRIICAEPSPDVAQAISAAFTAAGQVDANVPQTGQFGGSGSIGSSYAESIAQLGERLATVQLLRDKMYRACEAYQNGAISDTSYTLMLARFDKTMASMLASEVAAGAFGRNLATVGGSASTGSVDPKTLADARKEVTSASDQLKGAVGLADSDPSKRQKITEANDRVNKAATNLVELELQSAVSAAQSGLGSSAAVPGQIVGRTPTINSETVARIHANFLDDDASGTLIDACVVALDRNRAGAFDPAFATEIQRAITEVVNQDSTAARLEKEASEASRTLPQSGRADRVGGPMEEQKQVEEKRKAAENARLELVAAKTKLERLKNLAAVPTLGSICAAILKNGNQKENLLFQLQDHKLKARTAESGVALKQILVQGCRESTKDIPDKTGRADKYTECVSRALTLAQ